MVAGWEDFASLGKMLKAFLASCLGGALLQAFAEARREMRQGFWGSHTLSQGARWKLHFQRSQENFCPPLG